MYEIKVSDKADKVLRKWKKSNPQLWKKYQKIYYDLYEHPREGREGFEPPKNKELGKVEMMDFVNYQS